MTDPVVETITRVVSPDGSDVVGTAECQDRRHWLLVEAVAGA